MGVFIGLKLSKNDLLKIQKLQKEIDLPNPVDAQKIHCTLFISPDDFNYCGNNFSPIDIDISQLRLGKIKTQQGVDCLALFFHSPNLIEKHTDIKETYRVNHLYEDFKPHITLSYDCGPFQHEHIQLAQFLDKIVFDKQFQESTYFTKERRRKIR